MVGGKFDPLALHFSYNLVSGLKKLPAQDIRDGYDIAAWGKEFARTLLPEESGVSARTEPGQPPSGRSF